MSCGVGHIHGLAPMLLWLWRRPAAAVLIWPLVWELPYATGVPPQKKNNGAGTTDVHMQKKKKSRSSLVAQWAKDLVLSLLWHRFDSSWPQELTNATGVAKKISRHGHYFLHKN